MYKDLKPEEYTAISQSLDHVIEASFRSIRGLFILNGGGCVALITLMGAIVKSEGHRFDLEVISVGLVIMAIGIVFSTLAQFCRYQSRLLYFRAGAPLHPFRHNDIESDMDLKEILRGDKYYFVTTVFMVLSLVSFFIGVIFVYMGVSNV